MTAEAYARSIEDVKAAVALVDSGARLLLRSGVDATTPGIVLR